jgi:CopG-like RHH_1 or ribbon-helix-helix domain, RHH_5
MNPEGMSIQQAEIVTQQMIAEGNLATKAGSPTPALTREATKRSRTRTARRSNGAAASTPPAPGDPAVSITLPQEVYDYFKQQADADERTLAGYLKRVLRRVWQQERDEKAAQEMKQSAAAVGTTGQREPSNQC